MKFFALAFFTFFTCAVHSQKAQDFSLDSLVNQWHLDAAHAKITPYFSAMSENFVFLGTAPGERWEKETFRSFCQPYFDKGKAWDFTPSKRNWVLLKDQKTAWFDEDLSTWMGGCRGSGICVMENGSWKIAYYNLTVLIENEKMDQFIKLRDK